MIAHGRLPCTRCWSNDAHVEQERGSFRLVRDPGHWGATDPHTLVLGISKGNTQSRAFAASEFDTVAFKGIRHRILQLLHSVGLLPGEQPHEFERRFTESERDYAFASVVRCSLTGMDRKKKCHTADSPNVLPAFRSGSQGSFFVESCVDQHLKKMPSRTQLVLLLGNTDGYVKAMAEVIDRIRGSVTTINEVAYVSSGLRFVHLAHPSKGNGHFGAFIRGEGRPGAKKELAREALGMVK